VALCGRTARAAGKKKRGIGLARESSDRKRENVPRRARPAARRGFPAGSARERTPHLDVLDNRERASGGSFKTYPLLKRCHDRDNDTVKFDLQTLRRLKHRKLSGECIASVNNAGSMRVQPPSHIRDRKWISETRLLGKFGAIARAAGNRIRDDRFTRLSLNGNT